MRVIDSIPGTPPQMTAPPFSPATAQSLLPTHGKHGCIWYPAVNVVMAFRSH